jgi:fatty acid-binding protein DegV
LSVLKVKAKIKNRACIPKLIISEDISPIVGMHSGKWAVAIGVIEGSK